jgi:hypothetical protein
MKRFAWIGLGVALLLGGVALAQTSVLNYFSQTGGSDNAFHIGGTASVDSGGSLNIASGGALKVAGTDVTATVGAAVSGVAASYKVARGETALGGSNPTNVATGLTTIVACDATIKRTTALTPTLWLSYTTATATLSLYGWTSPSGSVAPAASAGTETVGWICVGT